MLYLFSGLTKNDVDLVKLIFRLYILESFTSFTSFIVKPEK